MKNHLIKSFGHSFNHKIDKQEQTIELFLELLYDL